MPPFDLVSAGKVSALVETLRDDPAVASVRNADGASLLAFAAYCGNTDALAAIRAALPTIDPYEACIIGDEAALRAALDGGWSPNTRAPDGFTPLGLTVFFKKMALFDLLLPLVSDVNDRADNPQKVGALHAAAAVRDARATELLLRAGADPDLPQAAGFRPLHVAAQHGDGAVAALLVLFGASVSLANDVGMDAITHAAQGGHSWLVKQLKRHF